MANNKRAVRLDSWKEIAAYLNCDERTVQRWEKTRGLPVHRVPGGKRNTLFAYSNELDSWLRMSDKSEALESWDQIAAYLSQNVQTVKQWAKEKGLPVHERSGLVLRKVVAYRHELESWLQNLERASKEHVIDLELDSMPDLTIEFDPSLSPEQITTALRALADYYRACGGVGFKIDFELEEKLVWEPVHV